jgi:hypothetical protein
MYTCSAENLIATKELLSCKKIKGRTEAPSTTDFGRSGSVFVRQRDRQQHSSSSRHKSSSKEEAGFCF